MFSPTKNCSYCYCARFFLRDCNRITIRHSQIRVMDFACGRKLKRSSEPMNNLQFILRQSDNWLLPLNAWNEAWLWTKSKYVPMRNNKSTIGKYWIVSSTQHSFWQYRISMKFNYKLHHCMQFKKQPRESIIVCHFIYFRHRPELLLEIKLWRKKNSQMMMVGFFCLPYLLRTFLFINYTDQSIDLEAAALLKETDIALLIP